MENFLIRQRTLIGDEATCRLIGASVLVFGLGGVGSWAVEALCRTGIGKFTLVDFDRISASNINRQLLAAEDTVGEHKTALAAKRIRSINSDASVKELCVFADAENIPEIVGGGFDFIIDAVDNVTAKLCIIQAAKERGISFVSCMGTGNKLDPTRFRISDISKTSVCPLARVMRRELAARGITGVPVLSSDEAPVRVLGRTPASISFVPSAAGLIIAGYAVKTLIGKE